MQAIQILGNQNQQDIVGILQQLQQLQQLQNQVHINRNQAANDEYDTAANENYFRNVFTPIVYPQNAVIDANTSSYKLRNWDSFLRNYKPKLTENSNISTWFGIYEKACEINEVPLEKRVPALIAGIMNENLQKKILQDQDFFEAIQPGNYLGRYNRIIRSLVKDRTLMKSITDAKKEIINWKPTSKILGDTYDEFMKKIRG